MDFWVWFWDIIYIETILHICPRKVVSRPIQVWICRKSRFLGLFALWGSNADLLFEPWSRHNFYKAFLRSFSSPHKFLMFLPVREIHRALHFILTFFTFRAEARPISATRQTGWRRSLRDERLKGDRSLHNHLLFLFAFILLAHYIAFL